MTTRRIEFWADSFHEGNWACEEISKFFTLKHVSYEKGFIPVFLFAVDEDLELEITVLGSYKNWSPLPKSIEELLIWGKPDLIAYDPDEEKILFAMEETAAVPTGNQALQRCERIYGSLRLGIPFWYLLGEFGLHVDGGVRRDSIWPTALGIKLSCIHRTPCIVLHYSDQDHPEDYTVGEGVKSLYTALTIELEIFLGKKKQADLNQVLSEQYAHMLKFVESQGRNVVNFIPNKEVLYHADTPMRLARLVTSEDILSNDKLDFFNWGKTRELPKEIYDNIKPGGVIKEDVFVKALENLVENKRAYTLSGNAGSRPQDVKKLREWLNQQEALFEAGNKTDAQFVLKEEDFPASLSGRRHVTTAKNVFYLADSFKEVENTLRYSFERLTNIDLISKDMPAFVYISNSLKPGRIFGDPFTGQLSAFANIFTKNVLGDKTRISIAYYPHQVHTQLLDRNNKLRRNKGIVLMTELLDYAVFQGGVVVKMKSGEII